MMQYVTDTATQGICPDGWHIPTDFEWKVLEGTVDSQYPVGDPEWDGTGWRGFDAGYNLKSENGWNSGGNGSDAFGFMTLPAGYCDGGGNFYCVTEIAGFWPSTEDYGNMAWFRELDYNNNRVYRMYNSKNHGFSVRCLKD